jgi:hypothetical protein
MDPSILGTLFERGLDPDKRRQLGAHYTGREMIERLIEPVVRRQLLAEWREVQARIAAALAAGTAAKAGSKAKRDAPRRAETLFRGFLDRLRTFRILDPACGSGKTSGARKRTFRSLPIPAVTRQVPSPDVRPDLSAQEDPRRRPQVPLQRLWTLCPRYASPPAW